MEQKNNTPEEIWSKLSNCKTVAMSLHNMPDGDSLGVCTAMKYVLEREFETEVTLVSRDNLSENLMGLEYAKEVEYGKGLYDLDLTKFDGVIIMDSSLKNFGKEKKDSLVIPEGAYTINIDHHATAEIFGNLNYVDDQSPAASSVLLDILRKVNIEIDRELAERLLLGICTDSGFFIYENAAKAMKDASYLMEKGARYYTKIAQPVYFNNPLRSLKYQGLLLHNLHFDEQRKTGIAWASYEEYQKLKLNTAEMRGGIKIFQTTGDFSIICTLQELADGIKGSLRSQKGIDISQIAKALGGGGHKAAAAFYLESMSREEAEKKIIEAIDISCVLTQ